MPEQRSSSAPNERLTEEYVRSLERRIAEQRRELSRLTAFDNNGGEQKARANRQARNRIAKLERIVGVQAVKLQEQYYALRRFKNEGDADA